MDLRLRKDHNLNQCTQYLLHMCKQLLRNRWSVCFVLLLFTIAALLLNTSVTKTTTSSPHPTPSQTLASSSQNRAPVFWVYHKTEQPLNHVISVFNRLGYIQGRQQDSWDVLWAYQYPYRSLPTSFWAGLKPHQRVNHFPGSGCFTYKPHLATMDFEYIPKAFQLPKQASEFIAEATTHPNQLWVKKSNNHRRIKILTDFKKFDAHGDGSFVQQFVGNPLLIDGRKFDIGVYTVITSVDPLRVYTYSGEVLVRFCSEDYEPFDVLRPKKYVVDDEYTRPSEVQSMATLLSKHSLSNKEALNILLKRKGFSPNEMWDQVNTAVREVLESCESNVISYVERLSVPTRHFFELVRFDFVIDDQFKVWLMEVNLSPNLSSEHFSENRLMYEQVVYNTLSLTGLARPLSTAVRYNGQYESVMLVDEPDIQVPLEACLDSTCSQCANRKECGLCYQCRSPELTFSLKMAFLEEMNRRGFTRVYPSSEHSDTREDTSVDNLMMSLWYKEKCQTEQSWCA